MSLKSNRPPRRQPQRTCVVCHTTSDKRALVRIVRLAAGGVQVDERGKLPGRGAYLCQQASCWQTALHTPVLQHALNTQLSESERSQLEEYARRFVVNDSTPVENTRQRQR
ncbi:MAG: YlxR family protein [Chloroflexi bacterium]|nr:YlxR family protein [Chloroflexota bacterium]